MKQQVYKKINHLSLLLIGIFVFFHLINHLFLLKNIDSHIYVMEIFRIIYRNIAIEILLLLSLIFQIIKTLKNIWLNRKIKKTIQQRIKLLIEIYLIYFIINHVLAIFIGRLFLGLDTNIYFAIAGIYIKPFSYYFIIYYFLAIFCFLAYFIDYRELRYSRILKLFAFIISAIFILASSSVFYSINIPLEYNEIYRIFL